MTPKKKAPKKEALELGGWPLSPTRLDRAYDTFVKSVAVYSGFTHPRRIVAQVLIF